MQEETAACASCGREVPKTLYCIYCGSALFKQDKKVVGISSSAKEKPLNQKLEPVMNEPLVEVAQKPRSVPSPEHTQPQVESEPTMNIEVEPEIAELMEDLKNNYIWKVKLCGVLCEESVSEEVFFRMFEEYVNKINQLNQVRNEKVAYYRKEFEEKNSELEEAKRKLEEMRVRAAVGQISNNELEARSPELEEKINYYSFETSELKTQFERLNDLMRDTPPKDIFDLEKTARRCLDSLDSMLTNGKISSKLGNELRKDLEAGLNIFDSIIGGKKQKEKALKDRLATLEARYKVGEINISEFEAQKRRINGELEQVWI
jgi:hypothetical protein